MTSIFLLNGIPRKCEVCVLNSDDFTRSGTERILLSCDSFWMSSISVSENWTTKCFLSYVRLLRAPELRVMQTSSEND